MQLTYNLTINANGRTIFSCESIPAVESGIVGDYFAGKPYQPSEAAVTAALPYRYRKAFARALKWWETSGSSRRVPLMCRLESTRGANMGTMLVTPNWAAGIDG